MTSTAGRRDSAKTTRAGSAAGNVSRALEWLWKLLHDNRHPQVLDCGPVHQATVDVLLRRGAKIHLADLITPALTNDPTLWDCSGKVRRFRTNEFLVQLPALTPGSLSVVLAWHLLDLLPRDPLPELIHHFQSYLQPGGMMFCLLREPYLPAGADMMWWLDSLTTLATEREGQRAFPYPALTNREMERLASSGSVKTFLTRTGRREVLVMK